MKLAVIGTGYVGLVSGACFSELGFDVTCVDRDARKISMLLQGDVPIYEPGLEEILSRGSNPEFLREGAALSDFMEPDRVVVGASSDRARKHMETIYQPPVSKGTPLLHTDVESAEMIKYASNAFLATKITFINEIAGLCEKMGVDIQLVSEGMGLDHRIGKAFLKAGPGYGGSCFPKDTAALTYMGRMHNMPITVVEAVITANDATKSRMIDKIIGLCDEVLEGKKIALFGVTFKPNTDDMREASSLSIVPALLDAGATVNVVDPQGRRYGEALLVNVNWIDNPYLAAKGAEAAVFLGCVQDARLETPSRSDESAAYGRSSEHLSA